MAISNLTIRPQDLEGKKISDIVGDTLVGTPAENKAKFDDYSEVIKEKFNALIDTLGEFLSSSGVGAGDLSDTIKLILENGAEYYVPKLNANNKIESKYIDDASSSVKGLMSASDKAKMDTLAPAVNSVTSGTANPPTSNAVYDYVHSVVLGGNDYVVEKGNSRKGASSRGGSGDTYASVYWHWRKWDSGIAECFGIAEYYVAAWEQWGGTYYGVADENNTYYAFNYPDNLFVRGLDELASNEPPIVIASGGTPSGTANSDIMCVGISGSSSGIGTNTHTPKMYVMRPQAGATDTHYAIFVHAIGRWK